MFLCSEDFSTCRARQYNTFLLTQRQNCRRARVLFYILSASSNKVTAMLFLTDLESTFVLDKSPLLSEFLAQIKTSAELVSMFDSIQRDAGSADSMDTS